MPAPDDQALGPAEEATVRARLAEARHTGPVPPAVVARLDAVLADLTAERREPPADPVAPVVPLVGRRRRVVASGLVAAAAVVALGVALPQVLGTTDGDSDGTSGSAAESGGSAFETGPQGNADRTAPPGESATESPAEESATPGNQRSGSVPPGTVALSSTEPLRPAVRALAHRRAVTAYDAAACALGTGAGRRVAATWDGLPAVVVLRPVVAARRAVDVYVCGSDAAVGSTTLPAR